MSLFGTKEKQEIERLQAQNAELEQEKSSLSDRISALEQQNKELSDKIPPDTYALEKLSDQVTKKEKKLEKLTASIKEANQQLKETQEKLFDVSDAVQMQDFGLYIPHYNFMRADDYKAKLLEIRAQQKDMVRKGEAVTGATSWAVNGNLSKGKKMVSDMQKLLLRAFNSECDDVIEHVKYNNIEAAEKRITSSKETISKLGAIMEVSIVPSYYRLKLEELYLAFEYAQKKQQEKEEQQAARAEMKEAAKLAREIEEERKKLEKEQSHYKNALRSVTLQLETSSDVDRQAIEEKKAQIEAQLQKIDKEFADVDYREANQRAGYVYVISNIGAFGENVYKIGMTRRLDPQDRIDELGSASVPFNFDVHAMIFSNDAPKLEAALHNAFADRKLNFVNQRREFFKVSLDEIKKVVRENYDKSVEFIELAPAEQYRESLLMQKQLSEEKGL